MDYVFHVGTFFCIFSIAALSLNLVLGYTGLPSVANASFMALGAYTTALMGTRIDGVFFVSLLVGSVLAAGVGLLLGLILGRFRDDYFLIVTIAFVSIIHRVLLNGGDMTRGPLGIPGISRPVIFGFMITDPMLYFFLALGGLVVVYAFCRRIISSSFGRVLKGIREDEDVLKVFGYKTENYKLAIFSISAGLSALAGSLYASYISFIDPSTFTIHDSVFVWAMIILGGLASLRGSLLGALILVLLPEALRFVGFPPDLAGQMRVFVYGALLIVFMMYRPQGLIGEYKL